MILPKLESFFFFVKIWQGHLASIKEGYDLEQFIGISAFGILYCLNKPRSKTCKEAFEPSLVYRRYWSGWHLLLRFDMSSRSLGDLHLKCAHMLVPESLLSRGCLARLLAAFRKIVAALLQLICRESCASRCRITIKYTRIRAYVYNIQKYADRVDLMVFCLGQRELRAVHQTQRSLPVGNCYVYVFAPRRVTKVELRSKCNTMRNIRGHCYPKRSFRVRFWEKLLKVEAASTYWGDVNTYCGPA